MHQGNTRNIFPTSGDSQRCYMASGHCPHGRCWWGPCHVHHWSPPWTWHWFGCHTGRSGCAQFPSRFKFKLTCLSHGVYMVRKYVILFFAAGRVGCALGSGAARSEHGSKKVLKPNWVLKVCRGQRGNEKEPKPQGELSCFRMMQVIECGMCLKWGD